MKLKCHNAVQSLKLIQMVPGQVYKHGSMPGLYLSVPRHLVALRNGLFVDEPPEYGWIHCPNATCIEEPDA